jgi:hypothetical protein
MASDNSFASSDNMSNTNNTPTIHELFEACEHLGDHISYYAETNKMYIVCNGNGSGICISHLPSGSYRTMLYYGLGSNGMTSGYYHTKTLSSDDIRDLLAIIGNRRLYDADRSCDIHEFFQSIPS